MRLEINQTRLDWSTLPSSSPAGIAAAYAQKNPSVDQKALATEIAKSFGVGPTDQIAPRDFVVTQEEFARVFGGASNPHASQMSNVLAMNVSLPSQPKPATHAPPKMDGALTDDMLLLSEPTFADRAMSELQAARMSKDPLPHLKQALTFVQQAVRDPSIDKELRPLLHEILPMLRDSAMKAGDTGALLQVAFMASRLEGAPTAAAIQQDALLIELKRVPLQDQALIVSAQHLLGTALALCNDQSTLKQGQQLIGFVRDCLLDTVTQRTDPELSLRAARAFADAGLTDVATLLCERGVQLNDGVDPDVLVCAGRLLLDLKLPQHAETIAVQAFKTALTVGNIEQLAAACELFQDLGSEVLAKHDGLISDGLSALQKEPLDADRAVRLAELVFSLNQTHGLQAFARAIEVAQKEGKPDALLPVIAALAATENPALVQEAAKLVTVACQAFLSQTPARLDLAEQALTFLAQPFVAEDATEPSFTDPALTKVYGELSALVLKARESLTANAVVSKKTAKPLAIAPLLTLRDQIVKKEASAIKIGTHLYTFAGQHPNILMHRAGSQPEYPTMLAKVLSSVNNDQKAFADLLLYHIDNGLESAPVEVLDLIVVTFVSEYDRDPRIPSQFIGYLEGLQSATATVNGKQIRDACPWMYTMNAYRAVHGKRADTAPITRRGRQEQAVNAQPVSAALTAATKDVGVCFDVLNGKIKHVDFTQGQRVTTETLPKLTAAVKRQLDRQITKLNQSILAHALSQNENANLTGVLQSSVDKLTKSFKEKNLQLTLTVVQQNGVPLLHLTQP